jgi:hypothetical protein
VSRFEWLNERYAAAASVSAHGVEMLTVGDSVGAHLDAAIKELIVLARTDGPELWADLLGAARQLRWRLVTEPQPIELNPQLQEVARAVKLQAERLHSAVGDDARTVLRQLEAATLDVWHRDPVIGPVLVRCIQEVGAESCRVLAAGSRSAAGMSRWFIESGLGAVAVSGIDRHGDGVVEQAYAVGPPRIFSPSTITSPTANAVMFIFPSWETNRSIPRTVLSAQAEGAIRPRSRTFTEGDEPVLVRPTPDVADDLVPLPNWTAQQAPDREPGVDEVIARKVLLSGALSIYLDSEGEHIRSLDPTQPAGERVTHSDVHLVGPGTYLVLREGQSERQVLYDRAIALLGHRGPQAKASQRRWKEALQVKLRQAGRREVGRALAQVGVPRIDRATAWTEETLARPQDDQDFLRLLAWLDVPLHPTFELATELRRLRLQASADVRESLERALSAASMTTLEEHGHLRLDLDIPGFRGIIATRVLAVSPHAELVARHDVRVATPDRSAQWLE